VPNNSLDRYLACICMYLIVIKTSISNSRILNVFKLFLHNSIAIVYIILRKAIMIFLREVKSKGFL